MCCTDNSQARGLPGTSDQSPCWKSFGVIFTAKGCTADQRATWKTGNCYRSAGLGAWNTECPLPLASIGGVCPAVSFWAGSKQHLGHIDGVPSLNISLGFTFPNHCLTCNIWWWTGSLKDSSSSAVSFMSSQDLAAMAGTGSVASKSWYFAMATPAKTPCVMAIVLSEFVFAQLILMVGCSWCIYIRS